jgi:hypothetical protein
LTTPRHGAGRRRPTAWHSRKGLLGSRISCTASPGRGARPGSVGRR